MRNGNFAPSGEGESRRQTGALDEKGPGDGLGQGDKAKMGYGSLEAETCSQLRPLPGLGSVCLILQNAPWQNENINTNIKISE